MVAPLCVAHAGNMTAHNPMSASLLQVTICRFPVWTMSFEHAVVHKFEKHHGPRSHCRLAEPGPIAANAYRTRAGSLSNTTTTDPLRVAARSHAKDSAACGALNSASAPLIPSSTTSQRPDVPRKIRNAGGASPLVCIAALPHPYWSVCLQTLATSHTSSSH